MVFSRAKGNAESGGGGISVAGKEPTVAARESTAGEGKSEVGATRGEEEAGNGRAKKALESSLGDDGKLADSL